MSHLISALAIGTALIETTCIFLRPELLVVLAVFPLRPHTRVPWARVSGRVDIRDRLGRRVSDASETLPAKPQSVSLRGLDVRVRLLSVRSLGWGRVNESVWMVASHHYKRRFAVVRVRFFATQEALEMRCYCAVPFWGIGVLVIAVVVLTQPVLVPVVLAAAWLLVKLFASQAIPFARILTGTICAEISVEESEIQEGRT